MSIPALTHSKPTRSHLEQRFVWFARLLSFSSKMDINQPSRTMSMYIYIEVYYLTGVVRLLRFKK